MSGTPVLSDSTSKAADVVEPPFGCTLGDGGRGASWVRVTGELIASPRHGSRRCWVRQRGCARIVVVDLRD